MVFNGILRIKGVIRHAKVALQKYERGEVGGSVAVYQVQWIKKILQSLLTCDIKYY